VDGLLYISRTSLPSLFARPLAGFTPAAAPPSGLTKYQHQAVVADLLKLSLGALVAHRPTHIIFDFIDERFDLLSTGHTLVTHSWELEVSGYRQSPPLAGARTITRTSDACLSLWCDAVRELGAFIKATPLSEARLVLHEARWADRYLTEARRPEDFGAVQIWDGKPASIAEHNSLLQTYEALFLEQFPDALRVAAPGLRLADCAHRWGLSPFHYVDDYYAEIWRGLRGAGVSPAEPARPAPPSAPEA
jgi:hypothetical protein